MNQTIQIHGGESITLGNAIQLRNGCYRDIIIATEHGPIRITVFTDGASEVPLTVEKGDPA